MGEAVRVRATESSSPRWRACWSRRVPSRSPAPRQSGRRPQPPPPHRSNLKRSLEFYQKVGMPLAGMQGVEADWQKPVVPMLAIGRAPNSFVLGRAGRGGRDRIDPFGSAWTASMPPRREDARGPRHQGQRPHACGSTPPVAELKFNDPETVSCRSRTPPTAAARAPRQPLPQQTGAEVSGPPPMPCAR